MSDEDREVEIESDEEDDELGGSLNDGTATQFMSQAEKGLIIMRWKESAETTLKIAFTVSGTLCQHCKEKR